MMLEECVTEQSRILKIDPVTPSADIIAEAVAELKKGGLVVAPTETRYGLLARGDDPEALVRMFTVKRRPDGHPTAVFLPSVHMIPRYAEYTPLVQRLAERFLPGPLTLIVKAKHGTPWPVIYNGTLGIRVSSSPVIAALVERVEFPVTATSANLSGQGEPVTISEIIASFGAQVGIYLDAGAVEFPPSTIVDCSTETAQIVRAGVLASEIIKEIQA